MSLIPLCAGLADLWAHTAITLSPTKLQQRSTIPLAKARFPMGPENFTLMSTICFYRYLNSVISFTNNSNHCSYHFQLLSQRFPVVWTLNTELNTQCSAFCTVRSSSHAFWMLLLYHWMSGCMSCMYWITVSAQGHSIGTPYWALYNPHHLDIKAVVLTTSLLLYCSPLSWRETARCGDVEQTWVQKRFDTIQQLSNSTFALACPECQIGVCHFGTILLVTL